ncbi:MULTISPECIES: GAF and ANTAR domain-containing protein [Streptacidiphilus]|uniref:GAF and ANTAR domain-containing protein n=1 Tax=Streptacidiphilus cavernicola TaxID=3342716 RepID=A0ABV6UKZ4_9ACTN|nr:GAF and ANTAR domain-containing protein [Streptacidiphilus jeojiense]
MIGERMAQVLTLLQSQLREGSGSIADISDLGVRALDVDGLTVSLTAEDGSAEPVWCSDEAARRFEDLQFTLGQGPGPEALRGGVRVLVPDLAQVWRRRWPELSREAPGLATRAVFCFPMGIRAVPVGVLTALRRAPGPLTDEQVEDAQVLAHALTARALGSGGLGGGVSGVGTAVPVDSRQALHHAVTHQATGMVSVQLDLSLPQALLRLRAHAFGTGRSITDISRDVVERRLRLDDTYGNGNGTPMPVPEKD